MSDILAELRQYKTSFKNGNAASQISAIPLFYSMIENLLMGKPSTESLVSLAADYEVQATDGLVLMDASVADRTVTLPAASDVLSVTAGTTKLLMIKKSDNSGNAVIITPSGSDTIEGDPSLSLTSPFQSAVLASDGNDWYIVATNGSGGGGAGTGDVVGPATSTDNAVTRFNGSSGTLVQNSAVTIDDSGNIATAGTVDGRDVSADGAVLDDLDARLLNEANFAAGSNTLLTTHQVVNCDTALGTVDIDLPAGTTVIAGLFQKVATNASTIRLFTPTAGVAINGVTGYDVTPYTLADSNLDSFPVYSWRRDSSGDWWVTPSATVDTIKESSGPTVLEVGAIADGQTLARSGADIIGVDGIVTPAGTADGDLLVRVGGAWDTLAAGTESHVLTVVSGAPAWAAASGGGGGGGTGSSIPAIGGPTSAEYLYDSRFYSLGSDPLAVANGTFAILVNVRLGAEDYDNRFYAGTRDALLNSATGGGIAFGTESGFNPVSSGISLVTDLGNLRWATWTDRKLVGKWTFFVVTWSASGGTMTVRFYVNGEPVSEGTVAGNNVAAGGNLCLGTSADGAIATADGLQEGWLNGGGYALRALTYEQVGEWSDEVMNAGQMVDIPTGGSLTAGWRASSGGGAPGATWTPFVGAGTLTRTGTAAGADTRRAIWG